MMPATMTQQRPDPTRADRAEVEGGESGAALCPRRPSALRRLRDLSGYARSRGSDTGIFSFDLDLVDFDEDEG